MMLYALLNALIELYKLALLAYAVLSWLHLPANKWTTALASVVEPVVSPVRRALQARLPAQWQIFDWSVVVVYLLIGVLQSFLRSILLGFVRW